MIEKLTPDEALAVKIDKFLEENRNESNVTVLLAEYLRKEVVDPATITGSLKLLEAHRNGLYDSIPEGDIDAMGLLNIIQNHLANVDASIATLKQSLAPAEVMQGKSKKPLDRMKAQEAEVVESEDQES